MDTIRFHDGDGKTLEAQLVIAFDRDGKPVELIGDIEPENCDHRGAAWSSCFDVRCPRCGARMFLPRRWLAHLPEYEIDAMHAAWERAGWPEFNNGENPDWRIRANDWTVIRHPLFSMGLAVRNDKLLDFPGARA